MKRQNSEINVFYFVHNLSPSHVLSKTGMAYSSVYTDVSNVFLMHHYICHSCKNAIGDIVKP